MSTRSSRDVINCMCTWRSCTVSFRIQYRTSPGLVLDRPYHIACTCQHDDYELHDTYNLAFFSQLCPPSHHFFSLVFVDLDWCIAPPPCNWCIRMYFATQSLTVCRFLLLQISQLVFTSGPSTVLSCNVDIHVQPLRNVRHNSCI